MSRNSEWSVSVPIRSIFHANILCNTGHRPLALPLGELSPQVTERGLQSFLNDTINLCAHTAKISVNSPVGETQNLQTKSRQELRTFRIISEPLGFIMLRPIQFNDQSGRSTVKVHDESADNPLFVNFTGYLRRKRYQSLRSWGVISLRSRRAFSNWALSFGIVIVYPLRPRYARPPLPKGEARDARTVHRKVYRSALLSVRQIGVYRSIRY